MTINERAETDNDSIYLFISFLKTGQRGALQHTFLPVSRPVHSTFNLFRYSTIVLSGHLILLYI